jgi:Na+/H+ antiporter NhaC
MSEKIVNVMKHILSITFIIFLITIIMYQCIDLVYDYRASKDNNHQIEAIEKQTEAIVEKLTSIDKSLKNISKELEQ